MKTDSVVPGKCRTVTVYFERGSFPSSIRSSFVSPSFDTDVPFTQINDVLQYGTFYILSPNPSPSPLNFTALPVHLRDSIEMFHRLKQVLSRDHSNNVQLKDRLLYPVVCMHAI